MTGKYHFLLKKATCLSNLSDNLFRTEETLKTLMSFGTLFVAMRVTIINSGALSMNTNCGVCIDLQSSMESRWEVLCNPLQGPEVASIQSENFHRTYTGVHFSIHSR